MTVSVANVNSNTDSFGAWVTKTNQLAHAMTTQAVTTNSNTATGNAAVSGTFSANVLIGNTIGGGNTSVGANITFSTGAIFSSQVWFQGSRVNLGLPANVSLAGGNATHRVVVVNSAASNTLVVTRLALADLDEFGVTSPGNGQVMRYNTSTSKWENTNTVNIGTSSIVLAANTTLNGTFAAGNTTVTGSLTTNSLSVGSNASANNLAVTNLINAASLGVSGAVNTATLNTTGQANVGGAFNVTGISTLTGNLVVNGARSTFASVNATANVMAGNFYYSNGTALTDIFSGSGTVLKVYYANGIQAFP